jgi:hypothetical protein
VSRGSATSPRLPLLSTLSLVPSRRLPFVTSEPIDSYSASINVFSLRFVGAVTPLLAWRSLRTVGVSAPLECPDSLFWRLLIASWLGTQGLLLRRETPCLPYSPYSPRVLQSWSGEPTVLRRMVSSGMLRRVALVRTDVSEELSASFIRVTRIGELGATLTLTSTRYFFVRRLLVTGSVVPSSPILVTLMKEEVSSSETSVLTRATRRNIPEDVILHSHRRENLKSYKLFYGFGKTL